MSDTPSDTPAGEGGGSQPTAVPFAINLQYIKDLSFENPRAPGVFQEMTGAPDVNVNVNVDARHADGGTYEVVLTITAEARQNEKTLFVVELAYGAVATVGAGVPEEHIRPIVMIEGPRLMFPFARNIIANATRDGGYPPLLVQPIDFLELYRQRYGPPGEQAPAGGAGGGDGGPPAGETGTA